MQRGRPCSFTIVHAPWPDCLFWICLVTPIKFAVRATPRMYTARWHRLQTHFAALAMLPLGHGQENRYRRTSCHPFLPSFHSSAADHLPPNRMASISNYPRLASPLHAIQTHSPCDIPTPSPRQLSLALFFIAWPFNVQLVAHSFSNNPCTSGRMHMSQPEVATPKEQRMTDELPADSNECRLAEPCDNY